MIIYTALQEVQRLLDMIDTIAVQLVNRMKEHNLIKKDNLYHLIAATVDYIQPGETIYIAPKLTTGFGGVTVPVADLDWYIAVHEADAEAVAKLSFDGTNYTMEIKYYVIDYYDWDVSIDSYLILVSPEELYNLCLDGSCKFYENYGIYNTDASWTTEESPNSVVIYLWGRLIVEAFDQNAWDVEAISMFGGIPHWS